MGKNKPVVCVFCSSSENISEEIKAAGAKFAALLSVKGFELLYGGTVCGFMKIIADSHKEGGGILHGVIPQFMVDRGIYHADLDNMITVEDMSSRKKVMLDNSDVIVTLPGGLGTYDEFFDLLVQKQLKRHNKPMFVLNADGYFDPMMKMIEHGIKNKTIERSHLKLFTVCCSPEDLIQEIETVCGMESQFSGRIQFGYNRLNKSEA